MSALLTAQSQAEVLDALAQRLTFASALVIAPGDVVSLNIGDGFEVVYPSEQIGFDVWRNGEPFAQGFYTEGAIAAFIEALR